MDKHQLLEALKGKSKESFTLLCGRVCLMNRKELVEGVLEYLLELERGKREGHKEIGDK